MNIIIEFTEKNQDIKEISQAIKIFLKKNKNSHTFTLIGPRDLLFTVNDEKNINIIDIKDENEAINRALTLSKEKNNVLICSSDINDVIKIATNLLDFNTNEKTLVTGTQFKTYNFKKPLMLININKINNEKSVDFKNSIILFTEYLNNRNRTNSKKYKLLDSNTEFTNDLDKILSNDIDYQGKVKPSQLLNADCDFVVCESSYISGFLEGFKSSFDAIEKIKNDKINDTFLIKIGKKLINSVDLQITNTLDKKTRSNGTILLGFKFPIIFSKNDGDINSLLKTIETAIN